MLKSYMRNGILTAGIITGLAILSSAARAVEEPTSPLLKAKTIEVTKIMYMLGHGGKKLPPLKAEIKIDKSGKFWIEQTAMLSKKEGGPKKFGLFIIDGKKQVEYDYENHVYVVGAAPKPGSDPTPHIVFSYYQVDMAELLTPDKVTVRAGSTINITNETLDGKPAILKTIVMPEYTAEDGNKVINREKIWFDAKTGVRVRKVQYYALNGGEDHEYNRTDYTNWKIDKPIPASTYAWTPPAHATVYKKPELLPVGTVVPNFEVISPDGSKVHLSDFKGKTVLIDFWATWCGPCKAEMPSVEKTYKKVKDKNVVYLAICVWDTKKEFDKWVKENVGKVYTFPVAFDPAGENSKASIASKLFNVNGIPTQYIIDKDGKVFTAYSGGHRVDNRAEMAFYEMGIDIPKPKVPFQD